MDATRPTGWQRPALVAIAVAGIAISIYLTATHNGSVPLVCTVGSVVNCASVTHSAYSVIPGTSIPISAMGILWFALTGALAFGPSRIPHLVWASLGLLVVLYLVFVEIVILHQICEWCTVVHLLVLTNFVIVLRQVQQA